MGLQHTFIINMKRYRKQAGITQEKLAELCNTDPSYIGQIETGRRFPSVLYIERIAAALCIPPYLLFYDQGDVPGLSGEQKQLIKTALMEGVSQGIGAVLDKLC
ncbi:MAG: helix-turn-helix domain-containing protein [Spirochaetaceae bacterium]|jgi:transcriptional regulator with XRE-family HTH domain|nr:helix-turn-helix domain-containing protein [Spirochaetaceae bacterium]